jgi:hypothetical protein
VDEQTGTIHDGLPHSYGFLEKVKKYGTNPRTSLESTTCLWNEPERTQIKPAKLLKIVPPIGNKPAGTGFGPHRNPDRLVNYKVNRGCCRTLGPE